MTDMLMLLVPGDVSDATLSAVSLSSSEVTWERGAVHPEFDVVGKDHLCALST